MKRWSTKSLGDIAKVLWGNTSLTKSTYVDEGFAAFSASGPDGLLPFYEHDEDGIILSAIGADCGKCFLANGKWTAIKNTITVTQPFDGLCIIPYLFYFLNNQDLWPKRGGGQPFISQGDARKVNVPVPPLPEQERIVKLLDEADELRKLRAQSDRRTAALIPALFHEVFGDPDMNPLGWPVTGVGDLMDACDYGTSQKANEEGLGIPVLRMGNVTTDGRLDLEDLKTVELADSELAKQRLQVGDVLFNRTNSRELVGKTGMWDGRFEAVPASYFIRVRFRPNAEHPQHFTTFMNLPSMKHRLAEMARGAVGQANINSKELKSIKFPVPPIKLQCEFATRVTEIREMESAQSASRKRLDDLFQSMLHRAFEGEL